MSYSKHTWENGETITAEKLNNIEQGIASKYYVVENAGTIAWNENEEQWVADEPASVTSLQLLDVVLNQQVALATMTIIDEEGTTREGVVYYASEVFNDGESGIIAILSPTEENGYIGFGILEDGTISFDY